MPTYEQPVAAKLIVVLDNGRKWEATESDYEKFGLVDANTAYIRFMRHLAKILIEAGLIQREKDITNCQINVIRHAAELAICMPSLLTHADMQEENAEIADIERRLRASAQDPVTT